MSQEEYTPDIVSVIDDEGKEHIFEELDRIETEKGLYVALCPLSEDPAQDEGEYDEFIVLKVVPEKDNDVTLYPIEDDEEYDEVGKIFTERLAELYSSEDDED
ncbi:MAG: DUF1292 domain-containing protein [Clostridia bacterium]|nr:DUF1292 domain-containing protein [Clostridia bacterium]